MNGLYYFRLWRKGRKDSDFLQVYILCLVLLEAQGSNRVSAKDENCKYISAIANEAR